MNMRLLLLSLLMITMSGCSQDNYPEPVDKTGVLTLDISGSALGVLSDGGSQDLQLFYRLVPSGLSTRGVNVSSLEYESIPIKDSSVQITIPDYFGDTYVGQFWLVGGSGKGYMFNETGVPGIDSGYSERGPVWYAEKRVSTNDSFLTLEFSSAISRVCIWTTQDDWEAAMRAGLREGELTATLVTGRGETILNSVTVGEPRSLENGNYRTLFETDIIATQNGLLEGELVLEGDNGLRNVIGCDNFPVGPGKMSVLAGRMLTVDVTFNITINPSFDGEYNAGL